METCGQLRCYIHYQVMLMLTVRQSCKVSANWQKYQLLGYSCSQRKLSNRRVTVSELKACHSTKNAVTYRLVSKDSA